MTDDFAEQRVASIFKIADEARGVINDQFIKRVGRAFYETTPLGG